MLLRSPELHPNGENATLDELKVAMDAAPNMRSYIRLTVIRSLLLGITRATICQQFCRTDRVVRLWIELFNRGGIDALITRPNPGRPRKVKLERVRDLLVPVLENPAQAGQVHWTGVKLHGYVKEQLQIELGYSTTSVAARTGLPLALPAALARTPERGGSQSVSGRGARLGGRSAGGTLV